MEDPALIPSAIGLIALGVVSFVVSLSETSLLALPREKVEAWKANGKPFVKTVATLIENRRKLLGFFGFLEWIVGAFYFFSLTTLATSLPFPKTNLISFDLDVFFIFLLGTLTYIFFFQFFPRHLALYHVEPLSRALGPSIALSFKLLGWVEQVINALSTLLAKRFGHESNTDRPQLTGEDIKMLVNLGKEESLEIEAEEKEMIESVMTFGQTMVKEIMTPRIDMVCLELTTPVKDVLDLAIAQGYSKFPVYEENIDNIVGIVYLKDLLPFFRDGASTTTLKQVTRKAFFVPESKKVDDLLREMQRQKIPMAIIVDEYGGTDGLVTIEDIVEEIVGEIADEHDNQLPDVLPLGENEWLVDGQINLEDLNSELGLDFPTEEFETLSGYVYGLMGKVPKVGDKVNTDHGILEVMVVHRQRISKVKLTKKTPVGAENVKEELS